MIGKLNPLRKSLSTRLLVVFVIASLLLTVLTVVTLMHGFAKAWHSTAGKHVELYLDYISEDIGNPPSEERALALAERLPVHIYINGPDKQFSTNGETLELDEIYFGSRQKRHRPEFAGSAGGFAGVEFGGNEDKTLLKSQQGDYTVYYELPHPERKRERWRFMVPALAALLTTLAVLFFIIRWMIRPVRDIRQGVNEMGKGNLSHRITVRRDNDLGTLANSINTMASDIEHMLDSKRQLLLGASHELRSPLTRATIATQLLPESKEQAQIADDLQEMEKLIADILESERMKSGHAILDREVVDLGQLIDSVLTDMHADNVQVSVPDSLPSFSIDPTRFAIMLRNLVGNAIAHNNSSNAPVEVLVRQLSNVVELTISDKGPGIAPEHIEKVTEPFYRTDESRTRQTGGFGLGLHLAKLIAEAHGGSLAIESKTSVQVAHGSDQTGQITDTGTRVIVTFPGTQ